MEGRLTGALRCIGAAVLTGGAVAALLAVAVPAPARAAEPFIEDGVPAGVEYQYGDEVSTETRWYVQTAVEQAWAYFAAHLDRDFQGTIVVVTNVDDAAAAWSRERGVSLPRARQLFSAGSGTFAGLATTGLTVIINDNVGSSGATIHEFTHLVQRHLGAGSSRGPRWLSEGAAEYFDMAIAHAWGIDASADGPAAATREIADEWAATLDNCAAGLLPAEDSTCLWAADPLEKLESAAPFVIGGGAVSAYNRASVAVNLLLAETGEDAYFCYLSGQGRGAAWRDAFADCFGMNVGAFYRFFDRARSNDFLPQVPSRFPELR